MNPESKNLWSLAVLSSIMCFTCTPQKCTIRFRDHSDDNIENFKSELNNKLFVFSAYEGFLINHQFNKLHSLNFQTNEKFCPAVTKFVSVKHFNLPSLRGPSRQNGSKCRIFFNWHKVNVRVRLITCWKLMSLRAQEPPQNGGYACIIGIHLLILSKLWGRFS